MLHVPYYFEEESMFPHTEHGIGPAELLDEKADLVATIQRWSIRLDLRSVVGVVGASLGGQPIYALRLDAHEVTPVDLTRLLHAKEDDEAAWLDLSGDLSVGAPGRTTMTLGGCQLDGSAGPNGPWKFTVPGTPAELLEALEKAARRA